jgi:hypothetical protein
MLISAGDMISLLKLRNKITRQTLDTQRLVVVPKIPICGPRDGVCRHHEHIIIEA